MGKDCHCQYGIAAFLFTFFVNFDKGTLSFCTFKRSSLHAECITLLPDCRIIQI